MKSYSFCRNLKKFIVFRFCMVYNYCCVKALGNGWNTGDKLLEILKNKTIVYTFVCRYKNCRHQQRRQFLRFKGTKYRTALLRKRNKCTVSYRVKKEGIICQKICTTWKVKLF